ncbi:MAG: hypothetical protein L6R36_000886 [Xanthoria steineri]|nr:MAG: hypothetical protein L6R36_000886 [Xanthoria steineri]
MGAAISALRETLKEGDRAIEEKKNRIWKSCSAWSMPNSTNTKPTLIRACILFPTDPIADPLDHHRNFLSPDATAKTEVPGIRTLRRTRSSTAITSENNFQKTVTTALNVFLGNASAGQKDESKYFVYMHHDAIVRVDVKLWRWNFVGTGFSDTYKSVMGCAYFPRKGRTPQVMLVTAELVYLISEYAGDSETEVAQYCEAMGKMYSSARKLKQSQAIASPSD